MTSSWSLPEKVPLVGKYCRLEPMEPKHADAIFILASVPDAAERYRYLYGAPPNERPAFDGWFENMLNNNERIAFAVVDLSSGRTEGMQSFMNLSVQHGSLEIGNVLWGPAIARTRVCTEAFYLFADYVFSSLRYRRLEWKCNNDNLPSRRAAERFGFQFEGVFRQHMLVNGVNRDTAWLSIIDKEWPALRTAYGQWLSAGNFNDKAEQLKDLRSFFI